MNFTASSPSGARLRRLLVLLLLTLGLLAGVSVSQTQQLEAQVTRTEVMALPQAMHLHELAARVDEQRGMAALHLTLHTEAERSALEGRLQASRLLVERRMAAFAQRLTDAADRQHHQRVAAGLAAFWDAQERLLASSRLAASDPAAAAQARALLTGEAQQVFLRLRADIQTWWSHTEQAAAAQAQEALATAQLVARLVWAQAALVAMALAMAWARPITRFWVHTCSFDHPSAVGFYIRSGFRPYATMVELMTDPRLEGRLPPDAAPQIPLIKPPSP